MTPLLSQRNQTEGSYFQILCAVQEGSLPLFFEWSKNGHSIKANPDVNYKIDNFEKYSTLIIAKIDRKDAGNYSCVVHNSIGSDSQSVLLSIKGINFLITGKYYLKFRFNDPSKLVPLSWALEPNDVTVNADKDLKLECRANGMPKPTVKWISSKGFIFIIE